jgi:pyruvate/2-oxoglutarate dehydrogenase complex dihydrolipoamide dehydrogenase (E3) component
MMETATPADNAPAISISNLGRNGLLRTVLVGGFSKRVAIAPAACVYFSGVSPEFARIGLSETEAKAGGIPYRLAKLSMAAVFRAMTISETRGFMKALIETKSDRILGFTMFGAGAGDVMAAVQMTMLAGLPYTALRDAIIAHPTMPEGLIPLLLAVPAKAAK